MKKSEIKQMIREAIQEEILNEEFQQQCHKAALEIRKSADKLIKKIRSNDSKRK
ncbi:MAG: hypothetical protein H8E98_06165 [Bacteroidetes bacterium]|nr:hypothetical protein [Bacteroidota bacterium]